MISVPGIPFDATVSGIFSAHGNVQAGFFSHSATGTSIAQKSLPVAEITWK